MTAYLIYFGVAAVVICLLYFASAVMDKEDADE